jgi:hypothetical protein
MVEDLSVDVLRVGDQAKVVDRAETAKIAIKPKKCTMANPPL